MKKLELHFDDKQSHQIKAIESTTKLFDGQARKQELFTVEAIKEDSGQLSAEYGESTGYANKLSVFPEQILANLQKIQIQNGLEISKKLSKNDFTIEMETGTGKTYVYLRTAFELNELYGFNKFIIVVPSVAIREGVKKTFEMTKSHFKKLYKNEPYDYFVYDSNKLNQVRDFATNSNIQFMIINIDSFNKDIKDKDDESKSNVIFRHNDRLQGVPIDFIRQTNPFVIIDEPQSVISTDKSKDAISQLNPLCVFRYSATHREIINLIYKLDPIDAYQQGLVKQIEVYSVTEQESHNHAYIKLNKVKSTKTTTSAEIDVDIKLKKNVSIKTKTVKQGADLEDLTGRSIYQGYIVDDIWTEKGNEYIGFSNGKFVKLGEDNSSHNQENIKRLQIRKTIDTHLDRELEFAKNVIDVKVLSLFFIDKVVNYRDYEKDDNKGKYARWFEEEYTKAIKLPKYETLFEKIDTNLEAPQVHEGYFSSDTKGNLKDTKGTTKADESTYDLIMKNKERLLSKSEPVKFIFSHSALKEGWDNPNVFQICTLNETKSEMKKRQEIGRGLRICVGQDGNRLFDKNINTLTVMVNEHYQDFVSTLQSEIESDTNIKFGLLVDTDFAKITITKDNGDIKSISRDESKEIFTKCKELGYIDSKGKVTDTLKLALKKDEVQVLDKFEEYKPEITAVLQSLTRTLDVKNAIDTITVSPRKKVLLSPEFKELWKSICHKTNYKVKFNNYILIEVCASSIKNNVHISPIKVDLKKVKVDIDKSGTSTTEVLSRDMSVAYNNYALPDILTSLQSSTGLKRKTIADILAKSGKFKDFKNNPQKFIDEVALDINKVKQKFIIDGIQYYKTDKAYDQSLFTTEEIKGYIDDNVLQVESDKYPFDYVVYDSAVEKEFAQDCEKDPRVTKYIKLPNWFKIPTPLGSYNPDWALYIIDDDSKVEKLFFVAETKTDKTSHTINDSEKAKIKCGKAHFRTVSKISEDTVFYDQCGNLDDIFNRIDTNR